MRLCIPALGQGTGAAMDVRLGRAPCLLFVDIETGDAEAVDNSENVNAAQGAGVQTAQLIVEAGARAVVAANCGPMAFAMLRAAGVKLYLADGGTVAELVERFKAGDLPESGSANCRGQGV